MAGGAARGVPGESAAAGRVRSRTRALRSPNRGSDRVHSRDAPSRNRTERRAEPRIVYPFRMRRLAPMFLLLSLPLTAADPAGVATFEGRTITAAEVSTPVENQLREIRRAEYDLMRDAVETHVFALIRERIAAKEEITPEALWAREVEGKAGATTAEEIEATVQQFRNRLPPDDAEARRVVGAALRQRRIEERERAWRDELLGAADFRLLLQPVRTPIAELPSDVVTGAAAAPVTIVEFSDFQCPYCAESQELVERIEKEYGERVRFVFKQLPLDIHPQARLAAEASLCARDQGKFGPLHDWLFANPRTITVEAMTAAAPALGLDPAALASCLSAKRNTAAVEEQLASARALGVNSTPTFFVNGRKVEERSWAGFARLIAEELPAASGR